LKVALNAVSSQVEFQAIELEEATKLRCALHSAVTGLLSLTEAYEAERESLPRVDFSEIFDIFKGLALDGVDHICDAASLTPAEKADHIVDLANLSLQRDGFEPVVCGLVHFLASLSSRRDFRALLPGCTFDSAKAFMRDQLSAIRDFLDSHAVGYVEDSCLFEGILRSRDTSDLVRAFDRFVPSCPADHELFVCLMQAVAANDVVRKLAADLLDTIARQRRELRERAAAAPAPDAEANAAADREAVAAVRDRLRSAMLAGETAVQPILDGLHDLTSVASLDDAAYVASLEQELAELRAFACADAARSADYARSTDAVLAVVEQVEAQLAEVRREAVAAQDECECERRALEARVADQAGALSALSAVNDTLSRERDAARDAAAALDRAARAAVADLEHAFDATRADCLRLLELRDGRARDAEECVARLRGRAAEEKKRARAAFFAERNERNALALELCELRKEAAQANERAADADGLRAQAGRMRRKADARERRHAQEVDALRAEAEGRVRRVEAEWRAKVDGAARAAAAEVQGFLGAVCRMFALYGDAGAPVSFAAVEEVLCRVRADVDRLPALAKAKATLDEVRAIVGMSGDVVRHVAQIAKFGDQREEVAALRLEVRGVNAWIERMFALYAKGMGMGIGMGRDVVDVGEMRLAIEEVLQKRAGKGAGSRGAAKADERPSRGRVEPSFDGFVFDH
jgi:hypothetical protein